MARKTLNLGILAHVDAGKTTLTERLLYAAGVIDEIGSVDKGTTQTDSLALERQRGITIKAAVVSFEIDGVTVNLIDTPGHPDFIAEVERVLSVLDGAVLVVSAVEGVQPQTRILMRALQRLRVPTLLFVNKIDRVGADDERVLKAISERLALTIVPMGAAHALGSRAAEFTVSDARDEPFVERLAEVLAERSDSILTAYLEEETGVPYRRLREELAAQTSRALVHPLFAGAAITGAGVEALTAGIAELLPAPTGDPDAPVSGTVFKIERGAAGEKIAYLRMFAGTVRTRERLRFGHELGDKVTAIEVFEHGTTTQRASVSAGEIARLWGLRQAQIGDRIGQARDTGHQFAPPTMEAVVVADSHDEGARLRVALEQLTEQDPLIDVRQDDTLGEISVSLYGEVQKEVIQATLASDYGIDVTFRETTTIYIERPVGTAEAVEILQDDANPFSATVRLQVQPGPVGSGLEFRLEVDPRSVPLYIYKTAESFGAAMTRYVRRTLQEGLFGWQVTDCVVTMTECRYYVGDGPAKPSGGTERTTAAHFRKLAPMVLMQALERAGTVVCEPMIRVSVETPADTFGVVLASVAKLGGAVEAPSLRGDFSTIDTVLSAARARDLQRDLPGLTGGEAVVETHLAGYQPVSGTPPMRHRTMANPLNREEYLSELRR